jgi:hypothetical protein
MLLIGLLVVAFLLLLLLVFVLFKVQAGWISCLLFLGVFGLVYFLAGSRVIDEIKIVREGFEYEVLEANSKLIITSDELTTEFEDIKSLNNYKSGGKVCIKVGLNMYGYEIGRRFIVEKPQSKNKEKPNL